MNKEIVLKIALDVNMTNDGYGILSQNKSKSKNSDVYNVTNISNGRGGLYIKVTNQDKDLSGTIIKITKTTVYNSSCEVIEDFDILGATEINEMVMALISMTGFYYYPTSTITDGCATNYLELSTGGFGHGILMREGEFNYEIVLATSCLPSVVYCDFSDEENEFIADVFASMFIDEETFSEYLSELNRNDPLYQNAMNNTNGMIERCESKGLLMFIAKEPDTTEEYYYIMYRPKFKESGNIIITNDDADYGSLPWVKLAYNKLKKGLFGENLPFEDVVENLINK